jgi:hypothetical protein
MARNVVRRDAAICLKLRDKPTLRGHRRSGVVDLSGHSTAPKPAAKDYCRKHSGELCGDKGYDTRRRDPREASVSERAIVPAGLAKDVEAVNQ